MQYTRKRCKITKSKDFGCLWVCSNLLLHLLSHICLMAVDTRRIKGKPCFGVCGMGNRSCEGAETAVPK